MYQHTYPQERVNERFYYTHGQLIIRGVIERKLVGLPDIGIMVILLSSKEANIMSTVPLDIEQMEQNLGFGYDIGYWSWSDMVGRPDQCIFNREELKRQRHRKDQMTQRRHSSLEELSLHMTSTGYHAGILPYHLKVCKSLYGTSFFPCDSIKFTWDSYRKIPYRVSLRVSH